MISVLKSMSIPNRALLSMILTVAHVTPRFAARASGSQPRAVGAGSAGLDPRAQSGDTWRLLSSSFLLLTCFLIRGYKILHKKELHRSLQV